MVAHFKSSNFLNQIIAKYNTKCTLLHVTLNWPIKWSHECFNVAIIKSWLTLNFFMLNQALQISMHLLYIYIIHSILRFLCYLSLNCRESKINSVSATGLSRAQSIKSTDLLPLNCQVNLLEGDYDDLQIGYSSKS